MFGKWIYKVKNSSNNKFVLKHVSESFVLHELKDLNSSKSTGLDEIPARFLKDAAVFLKLPITFIINMSISENYVPDNMKIARVKPLFKKNSNLDVGNYRPVSILSIVSKILEKSVYSQLKKFLIDNNLYELQSGFRNSYSTDTCLIHLIDHVRSNSAKGLYTGMIIPVSKSISSRHWSDMCCISDRYRKQHLANNVLPIGIELDRYVVGYTSVQYLTVIIFTKLTWNGSYLYIGQTSGRCRTYLPTFRPFTDIHPIWACWLGWDSGCCFSWVFS